MASPRRRASAAPESPTFGDTFSGTRTMGSPRTLNSTRKSGGGARPDGNATNVRVMVRVRPFSTSEIDQVTSSGGYLQSMIDMPRSDQVQVLDHEKDYVPIKAFNFDSVLWSIPAHQQQSPTGFADQERVYIDTGAIALDAAWEGMNSCIFAYGQTGSGKTHTMMGDPAQIAGGEGCADDLLGLIPRLCRQLFSECAERQEQASRVSIRKSVELDVSFIEIYNEQVKDLLVGAPGKHFVRDAGRFKKKEEEKEDGVERYKAPVDAAALFRRDSGRGMKKEADNTLQVREHPTEGPQVAGVCVYQPASYTEIIELINYGNRERHVAATKMNDRSSRSHAMFRITLRQLSHLEVERAGIGGPKVETSERHANLNLVDLAGSENTKKSGAKGTTMVEAQKINLSLTTLRRCIDALIDKKPQASIPYRDSTLTWLLRQNLGGNSKCFMLATVSPHFLNAHESIRTLEYAMKARTIVNQVRVNEDDTAKMLRDLERRLEDKQKQLLEECATSEQRSELVKELSEAQQHRDELQSRVNDMHRTWEEQQKQIEQVRAQKAIDFFRHARVFGQQAKQLSAVAKEAERQESELARFHEAASSAGHHDIDEMAASLLTNRQEVEQLLRHADQMKQKQAKLQEKERELEQQHERERTELHARIENLLSQQRAEKARGDATLAEVKAAEDGRVQQLAEWYENNSAQMKERHKKQLGQVRTESEELLARLQHDEERRLNRKVQQMTVQLENYRSQVRAERERSAKRMRAVQDAEMSLRNKLAQLRSDREQVEQELAIVRSTTQGSVADLSERLRAESNAAKELEARLQDTEQRTKEDAETGAENAEELREAAEQSTAEAERDRQELARVRALIQRREQACAEPCKKVMEYLSIVESGELPESWTMSDFRQMVDEFTKFRRAVISSRSIPVSAGGYSRPPQVRRSGGLPARVQADAVDGYTAADQVSVSADHATPAAPESPTEEPAPVPPPPSGSKGKGKRQSPSATRSAGRAATPHTSRTSARRSGSRTSGSATARGSVSRSYGQRRNPELSAR
eukprot:TRINITY_DN241_c1_g1_i4.p1 TRINITY_DN241_c1_g1~~TRINITY_DN241_c1_g1_i4.p1  ORF type:complete len:1059 (+),score=382.42 TRINITY_DN241_c1_g1_i4:57-3179(+)